MKQQDLLSNQALWVVPSQYATFLKRPTSTAPYILRHKEYYSPQSIVHTAGLHKFESTVNKPIRHTRNKHMRVMPSCKPDRGAVRNEATGMFACFYCWEPTTGMQSSGCFFSHDDETFSGSHISSRQSIIPHVPGMGRTFTSRLGGTTPGSRCRSPCPVGVFRGNGPVVMRM